MAGTTVRDLTAIPAAPARRDRFPPSTPSTIYPRGDPVRFGLATHCGMELGVPEEEERKRPEPEPVEEKKEEHDPIGRHGGPGGGKLPGKIEVEPLRGPRPPRVDMKTMSVVLPRLAWKRVGKAM